MSRYQGWSNWHTWNANLWIMNEYYTYKVAQTCRSGEEFREEFADYILSCSDGIDLDQVNWDEIYTNFVAE